MKNSTDFQILKKNYGENFAKFCRANFSTILEEEGLLSRLIEDNFAPNKSLYDDLVHQSQCEPFINFIYDLTDSIRLIDYKKVKETPEELMKKAGYSLYKCKNNQDVLSFKKYYASGEEICTFRDPNRIHNNHIFFAVKDNVDQIKRYNFKNPTRQDEYGTSVISIQIDKAFGKVSIKNRYNHTVINPDATFGNNLDNIIQGLTNSFIQHYDIPVSNSQEEFDLDGYVLVGDDVKWYKFNIDLGNIYYCPNNIIIKDDCIFQFDKNRYLLMDHFLIDKENKTLINLAEYKIKIKNNQQNAILTPDNFSLEYKKDNYYYDSFPYNYKKIEKIEVTKTVNGQKQIAITNNGNVSFITVDKNNRIIKYKNDYIEEIGESFFYESMYLKSFSAQNLKKIANNFCFYAENLTHFDAPELEIIGDDFLYSSNTVNIRLPKVKKVGRDFMCGGTSLKSISAPRLENVEYGFLRDNLALESLSLPNLQYADKDFLYSNDSLTEVKLPRLKETKSNFLFNNTEIKKIDFPNLEFVGDSFMRFSNAQEANLPKLLSIEDYFLYENVDMKKLSIPNCEFIGIAFMRNNVKLENFTAPKLRAVGGHFLYSNKDLKQLELPELTKIGNCFLYYNKNIKSFCFPKINYSTVKYSLNKFKFKTLIKRQVKLKKKQEDLQK